MHAALIVLAWIVGAIAVFYVIGFAFIGAVWAYVNVVYQCRLFRQWLASKIR